MSFKHAFDLALTRRPLPDRRRRRRPRAADSPACRRPRMRPSRRASARSGSSASSNVAPKLGLDFRQGAFRYSMAYDQQAMMGGGVCWLDYNNDGWLDLFAVNSYADVDMPEWASHGGLPQSALFQNVHGRFVERQPGLARRHPGEGHGLCGRRPERRRPHRPGRDDGDGRRAALEQRQRHLHATQTLDRAVRLVLGCRRGGRERRRPSGHLRRRLHEHGRRRSPARSRASRPTTRASATCSTSTRAAAPTVGRASRRSASRPGSSRRTSGTASARSSRT